MSRFGPKTARRQSLLAAGAFLLFVLATEPHRVHHSFHEHPAPSCPVYALAQGCHLAAAAPVGLAPAAATVEFFTPTLATWTPRALPAPASQRAPPAV